MREKSTIGRSYYYTGLAEWVSRLLTYFGVRPQNGNFDIELTEEELEADLGYGR